MFETYDGLTEYYDSRMDFKTRWENSLSSNVQHMTEIQLLEECPSMNIL